MSPTADERGASHVLTLEDLGNLTREAGKPAETGPTLMRTFP
jgi:hypothetical protein